MKLPNLKAEHQACAGSADRFRLAILHEIESLLSDVTLGVPIESRVKTWDSIEERLTRKPLELKNITDLDDLVGLRIILLFRRDLNTVLAKLRSTFDVVSSEDKASTLANEQFGYQSHHYVVRIPREWAKIPSLVGLDEFKAELQVRTLAQHIWAAASHKLQYKQQESVPPPLMRSIYRVSALHEIVDFEFERVLEGRQAYTAEISNISTAELLNVDLLASILAEFFPSANQFGDKEDYSGLLTDLLHFEVRKDSDLRSLLQNNAKPALKEEADQVKLFSKNEHSNNEILRQRVESGVYFSHSGLGRTALRQAVGIEKWDAYAASKDPQ